MFKGKAAESEIAGRTAVLAAQNLFGEAARAVKRNRKQKIAFVLLTIAITLIGAALARFIIAPKQLVFAVGPEGSSSYQFAQKLQAVLARSRPLQTEGVENSAPVGVLGRVQDAISAGLPTARRIRIRIDTKQSQAEPLQVFTQRRADLVIARTDSKLPPRTRAIAQLEHSILLIAVPKGGKVQSIRALKGKKVAVIANDARDQALVRKVLSYYDVAATAQIESRKADEWVKLFEPGGPAAVFFVARKSGIAVDKFWTTKAGKVNFELLEPDGVKALAERISGAQSETIEAGQIVPSPQVPDDDTESIAVDDLLVVNAHMSNAIAAELTAAIVENKDQLGLPGRFAAYIEPPSTEKDAQVLAHPGAAEYVDDDTKTVIDRYSDVIYLGMSLASIVGSIFLGLYSTVTRVSPVEAGQLTDAVLELTGQATETQDLATLVEIEKKLTGILTQVLAGLRDGSVARDGFEGFRLAFDVARGAIATQKTVIAAGAATSS